MGRTGRTYTIRGEVYAVIGEVPFPDGKIQFELRKESDGTVWTTVGKNLTPRAQLKAAGTDVAEPIASPVIDGAHYVLAIRDALKRGDYTAAIEACDKGASVAPKFPVMLGDKASTWARARNALVTLAAQFGASIPAEPTLVPVQSPAPVADTAPVPVQPTPVTPVATESGKKGKRGDKGKKAKVATFTHGQVGTFVSGDLQPYWAVSKAISSKQGGDWTWIQGRKAYNLDGSAGKPFDETRVADAAGKLDAIGIECRIDLSAPVPAVKGTATAGPVTVTRKPVAASTVEATPEPATPTVADPGPMIAATLEKHGYAPEVIADVVAASRNAAGFHGRIIRATPAPAVPVKPQVKVSVKPAPVDSSGSGTRDYALPMGTPVRRSAKALQEALALSGAGQFTVTAVKTDPGMPNLLRVTGSGDWVAVDQAARVMSATLTVSV